MQHDSSDPDNIIEWLNIDPYKTVSSNADQAASNHADAGQVEVLAKNSWFDPIPAAVSSYNGVIVLLSDVLCIGMCGGAPNEHIWL